MRLTHKLLLAASATAFALSGCNCDDALTSGRGGLTGKVCDPDSGLGLVNVAVTLIPDDATVKLINPVGVTGADGSFAFQSVPAGSYVISADLGGGATRELTAVVDETSSPSKPTVLPDDTACREPTPLPEGGTLVGQICNRHTGNFVTEAQVLVEMPNADPLQTSTDDAGNFELAEVPEGPQVVQIRGDGYSRAFAVEITKGQTTTLDLADDCNPVDLTQCGFVGHFCDDAETDPNAAGFGNLVGASVVVKRTDGQGEEFTDVTDVAGNFEVNGLTPASYEVKVTKDDFSFSGFYECVAGQQGEVIDQNACAGVAGVGRITGQVCDLSSDANGFFIDGRVDLYQGASASTASPSSTNTAADQDGNFHFDAVDPGSYTVKVSRTGYERVFPGIVVNEFVTTDIRDSGTCPDNRNDVCENVVNRPETVTDGRILLVVDRSGSMLEQDDDGQQKWTTMKNALENVTSELNDRVEFGLILYPDAGASDPNATIAEACTEGSTTRQIGPSQAANIAFDLETSTPAGGTPTGATMANAYEVVDARLAADGNGAPRPLAVLLATDGGPNCNASLSNNPQQCVCTNPDDLTDGDGLCSVFNCLDDDNTLAQIRRIKDIGIKTFVIGVLGVASFDDTLDAMADAGGAPLSGARHYYEANSQAALENALDAITRQVLVCHVEVPNTDLFAVDSIAVSVGAQVLTRDFSRRNGWDATSAHTIDLFGTACDIASAPNAADVSVQMCTAP